MLVVPLGNIASRELTAVELYTISSTLVLAAHKEG